MAAKSPAPYAAGGGTARACERATDRVAAAVMTWLVILGSFVTLTGLAGLGLFIRKAAVIRQLEDPEQARAQLHWLVALNMASVGLAGLGLALVVIGLIL